MTTAKLHRRIGAPLPNHRRESTPSARFIGRVGALALALGIGGVIAPTAIALAETGAAADTPSNSASEDSASAAGPQKPRTTSKPAHAPNSASDSSAAPAAKTTPSSSDTTSTAETSSASTSPADTDAEKSATAAGSIRTSATSDLSARSTVTTETEKPSRSESSSTKTVTEPSVTAAQPATDTAAATPTPPDSTTAPTAATGTSHTSARAVAVDATPSPAMAAPAHSPIGTPEQIEAEKQAERIVNNPLVVLARTVLKFAWSSYAHQLFANVGGPDRANMSQLDAAVRAYAMFSAIEALNLDPNDPKILTVELPQHNWYGQSVGDSRFLFDNPDTIYRVVPVNSTSSYVLTGKFEGGRPADSSFSVVAGLAGTGSGGLRGKDLVVNPDGTFTITIDSKPTAPGQTNHIQIANNSSAIIIRNTLSDWNTQSPMSLSVGRTSGPPSGLLSQLGGYNFPVIGQLMKTPVVKSVLLAIPAPPTLPPVVHAAVTALMMLVTGLPQGRQYMAMATTDPTTGQVKQPNMLSQPSHNAQFFAMGLQSGGYFQLADDQALVITIDPAGAGYFNVPVTNDWTVTNNYWSEQTSLNNAQAVANPDGTYTLVVSPTDPGVANWVSTGGLHQGTFAIRFQDLDPDSTDMPHLSSQVVPIDQLGAVLPAGTTYLTPQQRQAQLAARNQGYNWRFAPYPQS